jgi:acetyl esterase/lipase
MVPVELVLKLKDSYVPLQVVGKANDNPLLSPGLASDRLLQFFPPTSIMVGGLDPLLDDAIDYNTRIRRLGVPGTLRVYRSLPHGVFNFPFLPYGEEVLATVATWLCGFAGVPHVSTLQSAAGEGV